MDLICIADELTLYFFSSSQRHPIRDNNYNKQDCATLELTEPS